MSLRPTPAAASADSSEDEDEESVDDDVSEEDDDEEEDGERENDEPLSQESADLLPSSPIRRRDDDVSDPILLIMHVTTATSCFLPKTFSISSNALLKEMSPVKRQRVKAPVLQGVTSSSSVPRPLLPTRRVADQPAPLPMVFEEGEDGDDDFVAPPPRRHGAVQVSGGSNFQSENWE